MSAHTFATEFTAQLTPDQVAWYHEHGFIAVENVLSADEVAELQRVTDALVEESRNYASNTNVFDFEPGHAPESPRVRRIKSPSSQHAIYDHIMRHPRILDIVAQLIGPAIRTNGDKLNMKSPEFGSPVEWHQDWAFYPHTNDDLLAVGIPIDDMLLENGCLLVIPGSQAGPVYSHHQDGVFVGAVNPAEFDTDTAVPIELKAGGISIHHARTLHASAPNTSKRPRRLLLIQYCAVDAWPIMGVSSWDAFNAMILRGEPTDAPRLAQVPVRIPLPNLISGGTIYEIQRQLKQSSFDKPAANIRA
jgi:ectoine hydroxylase-related dioxygenase (phytanoyl-CoA dioxygenase family)